MKVSIIVTAYNKEKFIKKCLESVISQDCDNWELIITEDRSTDRTKEIIEEYIKDSLYRDKIKFISNTENKGVSESRNIALQYVNGDFVTFVDGDDCLYPFAISTLINCYNKTHADLVIGEFTNIDEKSGKRDVRAIFDKSLTITHNAMQKMTEKTFFNKSLHGQRPVSIYAKIFKTDIIRNNNIAFTPKVKDFEDMYFNLEYYQHINSVSYVHKSVYDRLWNSESMVNQFRPNIYKEMNLSLKEYAKLRDKYDYNPEYEKYLAFHMITILLRNGIENNKDPKMSLKEKVNKFYRFIDREPLKDMWNYFTASDGDTFGTKSKVWAVKHRKLYEYYKLKNIAKRQKI